MIARFTAIAAFLMSCSLSAQVTWTEGSDEPVSMMFEDWTEGSLPTAADTDEFFFRGNASDIIRVTLIGQSGLKNPRFELYDGATLIATRDVGSATSPRSNDIFRTGLPHDGTYTLKLMLGNSGAVPGDYTLRLTRVPYAPTSLDWGKNEGYLDRFGDTDTFSLEVPAMTSVQLTSQDLVLSFAVFLESSEKSLGVSPHIFDNDNAVPRVFTIVALSEPNNKMGRYSVCVQSRPMGGVGAFLPVCAATGAECTVPSSLIVREPSKRSATTAAPVYGLAASLAATQWIALQGAGPLTAKKPFIAVAGRRPRFVSRRLPRPGPTDRPAAAAGAEFLGLR